MFLETTPGRCFVALDGEDLVGAVMCGCDGRRGYLHHLAVREVFSRALKVFKQEGLIDVATGNIIVAKPDLLCICAQGLAERLVDH